MDANTENQLNVLDCVVKELSGAVNRAGFPLAADALQMQGAATIEQVRSAIQKREEMIEKNVRALKEQVDRETELQAEVQRLMEKLAAPRTVAAPENRDG